MDNRELVKLPTDVVKVDTGEMTVTKADGSIEPLDYRLRPFPVTSEIKQKAVNNIKWAMDHGKLRTRLSATKALIDMEKFNLELNQFEDKKERLDSGKPTEIIQDMDRFEMEINALLGVADQYVIDSAIDSAEKRISKKEDLKALLSGDDFKADDAFLQRLIDQNPGKSINELCAMVRPQLEGDVPRQ